MRGDDDIPVDPNGCSDLEHAEMQMIREALGAIAVAGPATYWLYRGKHDHWYLRRDGDVEARCYPDRDQALQALRLAVVRCAAYRLYLQMEDGGYVRDSFNWLATDEDSFG